MLPHLHHLAAWFEEEKGSQATTAATEMYSAERQESMRRQVGQLHQREEQSSVSKECREWQDMARREKHAAQFAQSATSAANFISVIF
jgi:hypothetical protein